MRKSNRALLKEIGLILSLKILFIVAIWHVCFSHPVAKQLTGAQVANHLFTEQH